MRAFRPFKKFLGGDDIIRNLDFDKSSRYLVTKTESGRIELQAVDGKSLIDAGAARALVRDMGQACKRMDEMCYRFGVLSGDCDIARLEHPIE